MTFTFANPSGSIGRLGRSWVAVLPLLVSISAAGQTVPAEHADLYAEMEQILDREIAEIDAEWDGSPGDVAFGAVLRAADSHRGNALLDRVQQMGVVAAVERLIALGCQGVVVKINFPVLHPNFHSSSANLAAYTDFYRRLGIYVRSRGLRYIVANGMTTPSPAAVAFYSSLDWQAYKAARVEVVRRIARDVQPDMLSFGSEPDVEAIFAGQPTDQIDKSLELINSVLAALESEELDTMPLGAGMGTWQKNHQTWATSYAQTNLDFIDVHLYPINMDFVDNMKSIASIAQFFGKDVSMSEGWLYKARTSELGTSAVEGGAIFHRDPFSFWSPLDQKYLELVVKMARFKRFSFAGPFFSNYFDAYLDYEQHQGLSGPQLILESLIQSALAIRQGLRTPTADRYAELIQ